MQYAVSYARVSTEDQARKELSVPAQFRRMDNWANNNDTTILLQEADEGVSSFKERDSESRDGFWRAVDYACREKRVTLFLIDDQARFFRDPYLSGETKARLRRNGVKVLVTSNPYDPETVQGVWMESIDMAQAKTSSLMTSLYTFRGMEENAKKRDSITGWCFKNGGRAPFGYKAIHVVRGQDTRGRDIIKTLWEIHDEAAEVLRFMYCDYRINNDMSYVAIRNELNRLNKLSPTIGRPWTISSIIEMMREDRILQYAGIYFWNKEDHKTIGRRFKDKSVWIKVDNAHPGIISLEESAAVIEINRLHSHDNAYCRTEHSPYLLTGQNILGEDMFICKACGARMTSYQPARRSKKRYLCGTKHYRGQEYCQSNPIDKDWLESTLLNKIKESFGTKEVAIEIADRINKELKDGLSPDVKAQNKLEKQLSQVENKINNLVRAVADGFDLEIAKTELDSLKNEKGKLKIELESFTNKEYRRPKPVSAEDILQAYKYLDEAFQTKNTEQKRRFLRCFVKSLEYDPDTDLLNIRLFSLPMSSACILIGAQDRT